VAGNTGALLLAGAAGGLAGLGLGQAVNKAVRGAWMEHIPQLATLDELNYRSVALGFPLLTLGVILGAFWGHVAWGRYWAWDPKETWAFISWLVYGFFLHFRIAKGWQGRKLAWIGLAGFVCIIFTYWGVNFLLSGLHAYAAP
jgi:cytochrome c-type biogenesis protein CcsB